MPDIKNCVAVDWREGKDRCYFFFKDTNTFSRFNNADNEVPAGYPAAINSGNWGDFHSHARFLRFGFTTTHTNGDYLNLFYLDGQTPMVCYYHQQTDKVGGFERLTEGRWSFLAPYFEKIVAGVWWISPSWQPGRNDSIFLFLMNDGYYLRYDATNNIVERKIIDNNTWPGVAPYKYKIITAVQFDRDFADDVFYIFLEDNLYLKYNITDDKFISGPHPVDDGSWPGLV